MSGSAECAEVRNARRRGGWCDLCGQARLAEIDLGGVCRGWWRNGGIFREQAQIFSLACVSPCAHAPMVCEIDLSEGFRWRRKVGHRRREAQRTRAARLAGTSCPAVERDRMPGVAESQFLPYLFLPQHLSIIKHDACMYRGMKQTAFHLVWSGYGQIGVNLSCVLVKERVAPRIFQYEHL